MVNNLADAMVVIKEQVQTIEELRNEISHTKERNDSAELFSALLNFRQWTYTDEGAEKVKDIPDKIWFPIQSALKNSLPCGENNKQSAQSAYSYGYVAALGTIKSCNICGAVYADKARL